jgi:hypothetical protein
MDEAVLQQVLGLEQILDELFQIAEPGPLKNTLWRKYLSIAGEKPGDTITRQLPGVGDYIMTASHDPGIMGRVTRLEGEMYYLLVPGSGEMSFNLKFYPYRTLLKARTN